MVLYQVKHCAVHDILLQYLSEQSQKWNQPVDADQLFGGVMKGTNKTVLEKGSSFMMKDTLFTKTVGLYFRYGNSCSKEPQPECSGLQCSCMPAHQAVVS